MATPNLNQLLSNAEGRITPNHPRLPSNRPSLLPRRVAGPSRPDALPASLGSNLSMLRDIQTASLTGNTMNTSNGQAIFNLVFPAGSSERSSMDVPLREDMPSLQERGAEYFHCDSHSAPGVCNAESDAGIAPRADYEIYYNQLLAKKRGSPLWVPGPGMQLPIAYRRRGVSIGDVGLIYCSGGFDFLFNIFLPADHPIHRGRVPEGFHPLGFAEIEDDIEKTIIYGANSYLASSTLRKTSGVNSDGLTFETSAREAAILVMPDGALTQNLLNLESVREYVAANASQWYKYAIRKRGRTIRNGDIRIVVGCDMASSWGIATLASGIEQTVRLEFRGSYYGAASRAFSWECIGTSGHGRVGPQEAELRDLRQENDVIPLQNQCVFVRTMNLTLSGETWSDTAVHNYVWSGNHTSSGSSNEPSFGGSSNTQPRSASGGLQPSHLHANANTMQLGVSDAHPSTSLNKFLLEKHPKARMVITQDADWISAMNDDVGLPLPDELCARVLALYDACETNGIVALKSKNPDRLASPDDLQAEGDSKANLCEKAAQLPLLTYLCGQVTLTSPTAISTGSTSDVFQGAWLNQQKVALRLLKVKENTPAAEDHFARQVGALRDLRHPNVLQFYGTTNIDGSLYSVTPWMDNGILPDYLVKVPSVDRLKLLSEVASGLEYLHENGIIHGDLRGANVLISKDGQACLCDFGLSRLLEGSGPVSLVNLRWTAPEVLSRGIVSKHSDVWSFGMVGLEILSNEVPFYGKDDDEVKRQLIHGRHPDRPNSVAACLSELPFEMKHSVLNSLLKCWAKVPDERPSMSNLSVTLERVRVRGSNTAPVDHTPYGGHTGDSKLIDRNLVTGLSTDLSSGSWSNSALSTWGPSVNFSTRDGESHYSSSPIAKPIGGHVSQVSARTSSHTSYQGSHSRPLTATSVASTPSIDSDKSPYVGNRTPSSSWIPSPPPVATRSATIDGLPSDTHSPTLQQCGQPQLDPTPHSDSKLMDRNLMIGLSTKFSSGLWPTSSVLSASGSSVNFSTGDGASSPILGHDPSLQRTDSYGIPSPPPSPELQAAIENPEFTWKTDDDGVVVAGTLEGLVQFLVITIDSQRHKDYRDIFSMACAEVTTPDKLFQIIARRLNDAKDEVRADVRVSQHNAFLVIEHWLKLGYVPSDPNLRCTMKCLCEHAIQSKSEAARLYGVTKLQQLVDQIMGRSTSPSSMGQGDIPSANLEPHSLAVVLSLLEGENYQALRPSDYVLHLTKNMSENVNKFYETNEKIKLWVIESILQYDDVLRRAEVMAHFIKTALECRDMRNLSSAIAIISALYSAAIQGLGVTKKSLTRDKQGKLISLYQLVNSDSDYRGYWDTLKSAPTAEKKDICIPWLKVHLIELGKALSKHPVTIQEEGQHLINLERYTTFMARSKELLHYTPPSFGEHHQGEQFKYLQAQLRTVTYSQGTDERLLIRSAILQGREVSHRRSRREQMLQLGFQS